MEGGLGNAGAMDHGTVLAYLHESGVLTLPPTAGNPGEGWRGITGGSQGMRR